MIFDYNELEEIESGCPNLFIIVCGFCATEKHSLDEHEWWLTIDG
jgi:hypothetical protein